MPAHASVSPLSIIVFFISRTAAATDDTIMSPVKDRKLTVSGAFRFYKGSIAEAWVDSRTLTRRFRVLLEDSQRSQFSISIEGIPLT
jgi:hypothetical protein